MSDLDKDIENLKIIAEAIWGDGDVYLTKEDKKSIENVLKILESYREDYSHRCQLAIDRKNELEIKDKMIDKMAQELIDIQIKVMLGQTTITFINKPDTIEHFRKEVLKDE